MEGVKIEKSGLVITYDLAFTDRRERIDCLFELDDPSLYSAINWLSTMGASIGNTLPHELEVEDEEEAGRLQNVMEQAQAYRKKYEEVSDKDLYDLVRNRSRESFYDHLETLPNYDLYGRKDSWSIGEAISLLLNLNPKFYTWKEIEGICFDSDKDRNYKELRDLMHNSARNNKFGSWKNNSPNLDWMHINPKVIMNWAIDKKLKYPQELHEKVKEYHETDKEKNKQTIITQLQLEIVDLKKQITLLESPPLKERFPKYLKQSIKVFDQCWDELPDDMKRPLKKNLTGFYKTNFGEDLFMQSVINVAVRDDISNRGRQKRGRVKPWRQKNERK